MDFVEEIQSELDIQFPGTRLEFVDVWGYWVITDYVVAPDGSPATGVWYPTPWNLLPVTEGPLTNRKIVFILSHPDTAEPVLPSCENVLNTMHAAYTGGSSEAFDAWIDRVEEAERAEKLEAEKESRMMMRDAASQTFDRHHGKITSTSAGVFNHSRADDFLTQQLIHQSRQAAMMSQGLVPQVVAGEAGPRIH